LSKPRERGEECSRLVPSLLEIRVDVLRQRSLREISSELVRRGHLNERGNPFSASAIRAMLVRRELSPNLGDGRDQAAAI
jgi:hypothetical protein